MSKFVLILGPSGVGKSTLIRKIISKDNRFRYVSPFITRPLRDGERDKISISNEIMDEMIRQKKFIIVNELYGVRYGTPKSPIRNSLKNNEFPILDWPVSKLGFMKRLFGNDLLVVYLAPPSIKVLKLRLEKDGRDQNGVRFKEALLEIEKIDEVYKNNIDVIALRLVSYEDNFDEMIERIFEYL